MFQRGPAASVLCCSIHARYHAMVIPNWCQQAGPQPCASIDEIPRPILQDHLYEWHGVMHQNKQLVLYFRNIGAYVKWTRLYERDNPFDAEIDVGDPDACSLILQS